MDRIVVTGGCGFMGSHLVDRLEKDGYYVTVWDRKKPASPDVAIYSQLKYHCEKLKPSVIFDLATLPLNLSLIKPYMVTYKLFCMANNLCELLREGYYKTLIHISSSEVYQINTPYAAAKDAQDKLIEAYVNSFGINAKIVRPFNTYGPRQDLGAIIPATIKRILRKEAPIIAGTGRQRRDLVYVDDIIRGILWVWEYGERGKSYDITTEDHYSVKEIVAIISEMMKSKKKPKYIKARRGDTPHISGKCEIDDIEPLTEIEEGLKRTIQWWKKHST